MRALGVKGLATLVLVASSPSVWAAEVSGQLTLASSYVFRGIDQSNENPAIQGGFDYQHRSGAYAGVWASNFSGGPQVSQRNNIETDYYAGYQRRFEPVTLDAGYIVYDFPHSGITTQEAYFMASVTNLTASFYVETTSEPAITREFYFNLNGHFRLPRGFRLRGGMGMQTLDGSNDEVADALVGVSKVLGDGFFARASYTITAGAADAQGRDADDDHLVLSLSKRF